MKLFARNVFIFGSCLALLSGCNGGTDNKEKILSSLFNTNVCNNINSSSYKEKARVFFEVEMNDFISSSTLNKKSLFGATLNKDCKFIDTISDKVNFGNISINNEYINNSSGFSIVNGLVSIVGDNSSNHFENNFIDYYFKNISQNILISSKASVSIPKFNVTSISCDVNSNNPSCSFDNDSPNATKYFINDNISYPDLHVVFVEYNNSYEAKRKIGISNPIILSKDSTGKTIVTLSANDAQELKKINIDNTETYLVYSNYYSQLENDILYMINYNYSMKLQLSIK